MKDRANFTQIHSQLDRSLARIGKRLRVLQNKTVIDAEDVGQIRRSSDHSWERLVRLLELEEELKPVADRVLGEGLQEISDLSEGRASLLNTYRRFIGEIEEFQARVVDEDTPSVEPIARAFADFLVLYEKHTEVERGFFRRYSTLLNPAGSTSQ